MKVWNNKNLNELVAVGRESQWWSWNTAQINVVKSKRRLTFYSSLLLLCLASDLPYFGCTLAVLFTTISFVLTHIAHIRILQIVLKHELIESVWERKNNTGSPVRYPVISPSAFILPLPVQFVNMNEDCTHLFAYFPLPTTF